MIRVAVKAVIVWDDKLLVTVCRDREGEFREEIGMDVEVGELVFVRDYIGRNHEFAATQMDAHAVELMFACRVPDDYEPRSGPTPDPWQHGVRRVPLDELPQGRLYPKALTPLVLARRLGVTYLGDVN